jgi:hypothetical protein
MVQLQIMNKTIRTQKNMIQGKKSPKCVCRPFAGIHGFYHQPIKSNNFLKKYIWYTLKVKKSQKSVWEPGLSIKIINFHKTGKSVIKHHKIIRCHKINSYKKS